MAPVVGLIKKEDISWRDLTLNLDEVEDVFVKSLEELSSPEVAKYTQFRGRVGSRWERVGFTLPLYRVQPFEVWGLTAIITFNFLSLLLPRKVYKHKLRYQQPWRR